MIQVNEDYDVIKQVLEGKTDYFSVLMNKYYNELFSFIFNMTGQYQDTEDLSQEIFMKIYKNLKKYNKSKSSFRTWMYRIASNHTINYLKSSYKRHKTSSEVNLDILESTEDIEEQTIKQEDLSTVIMVMKNTLSEKHQQIMFLHYFSGLTVKEISETLKIPIKTIYKAIKTSLDKIKKEVT